MDISNVKNAKSRNEKNLLGKNNVVSVGYGYKIVNGKRTDELCVIVGVTKKVRERGLKKRDIVPKSLDSVPTDVVELGHIRALAFDPTQKHRPAPPGSSIAHYAVTAGTFGALLKQNGQSVILSNNHVLANSNDASVGDPVYQPGPIDGGTSNDRIGVLHDFVPIAFPSGSGGGMPTCPIASFVIKVCNFCAKMVGSSHRVSGYKVQADETNYVDAALAMPDNIEDVKGEIPEIGSVGLITPAELGMEVQKFGRTTTYTKDSVLQLGATVSVSYGPSGTATFTDQIIAGPMSAGGDSGSVVLDMKNHLVGLLFAGSDAVTILNPIDKVFDSLNIGF